MIEEMRADHWTDREAGAGLTGPGGAPVRVAAVVSPWQREPDTPRPAGLDPSSALPPSADWCC
ncbi:hypothetical protein E2C00_18840 [Streptomyces sp. WAC05374]|uniref:hypothetical protein n=2 Tax=Streptomyces sp. WAC05374 TaxID=2487420 RepID=UPI000F86D539|nr:hypothetical protein [Streptomyces sp. WAC05374]TDF52632.1 hypothetical protein E2C02_20310 [Streptomyces sp. WAC05374]TDF54051.1 hypothetical protein E2C00_18840 [Streptomyces sp. WAC05374]